jgi:hypothetical protein
MTMADTSSTAKPERLGLESIPITITIPFPTGRFGIGNGSGIGSDPFFEVVVFREDER